MYNADAIRAFLTVPNPHADPEDYFQGRPTFPEDALMLQPPFLFHVTRLRNLRGILTGGGLRANLGGTGGAGEVLAGGIFAGGDAGYIFAGTTAEVVDCYIHEYDTRADNGDLPSLPILFRFREGDTAFEPDPQHEGAVRTTENIPLGRLEMLTFDGWVPMTVQVSATVLETLDEMREKSGG